MSMDLFLQLRKQFDRIIYHSYEFKNNCIVYHFSVGEHHFYPEWKFDSGIFTNKAASEKLIETCVFNLGMAELVSYWKCACPKIVEVRCGNLNSKQILWWKKMYYNGQSEFFYRNGIDVSFADFMTIEAEGGTADNFPENAAGNLSGCLIPVGGGKDSVVTLELLSDLREQNSCYIINPRPATLDCARLAEYKSSQITAVKRTIDNELLELNKQGFLNGHTPLSAVIAFSGYLFALLTGKKYIVLSNESSANESYVSGKNVNHQYSKSTEFEGDFREYSAEFLSPDIEYFSLLRPLSEYQIAGIFTHFPKYFKTFQSCNLGSKTNVWCGKCAKCLYVYVLLAAFLDDAVLFDIFGVDMLNDLRFEKMLDALAFEEYDKPFECVGTRNETNLALQKALQLRSGQRQPLPVLLEKYRAHNPKPAQELTDYYDTVNFVPDIFRLKERINYTMRPGIVKKLENFFKGKKILILGFGREGKSTLALLNKYHIPCEIEIADKNAIENPGNYKLYCGEDYLSSLTESACDIIMKSPGIALFNNYSADITSRITSQTDLLLRFCSNTIIGVTGTKGKSTVSSLICHILKRCGEEAVLIGNIGVPPLELCGEFSENTIIVCEMSCHQLEYVKASPDIAVLLNIYEEHLDHYTNFNAYKKAKLNIFKYQDQNGLLIINDKIHAKVKGKIWRASENQKTDIYIDSNNTLHVLNNEITEEQLATSLPARHNLYNAAAAIAAAVGAGCEFSSAAAAVSSFKGLPHRLEKIGEVNGILYVNDSICTIPDGTIGAVKAFPGTDTLIVGGMDRGISYQSLIDFLPSSTIQNLICLPDSGHRIAEELKGKSGNLRIFIVKDMEEAVKKAREVTKRTCILSPAAASYGFYRNFEERGKHFRELVLKTDN